MNESGSFSKINAFRLPGETTPDNEARLFLVGVGVARFRCEKSSILGDVNAATGCTLGDTVFLFGDRSGIVSNSPSNSFLTGIGDACTICATGLLVTLGGEVTWTFCTADSDLEESRSSKICFFSSVC